MGAFYTDKQGRTRPITLKKGGGLLAAAALITAVATAGGGLAGLGGAGSGSGFANAGARAAVQARVQAGQHVAARGQHTAVFRRLGVQIIKRTIRKPALNCVAHSYGEVRVFFAPVPVAAAGVDRARRR